ncbi:MAG: agmatine deiminase family protein [Cytophagales bacterium]|nr:agmatine deiminase family protein [Cytophagales bacterium]
MANYHMPAEWAPHTATWLSWPHNADTWGNKLEGAELTFAKMVEVLTPYEKVNINVKNEAMKNRAMSYINDTKAIISQIKFYFHSTNDNWCRDHGPIYVKDDKGNKAITNWEYNSWGGKYPPFDDDNSIPKLIANAQDIQTLDTNMVLEGGSIDVNGEGTLITTKSCLLHKNRNPHFTINDIEAHLSRYLGAKKILWLEEGIAGDDTDGHIDDITRFVNAHTIVTAIEDDTKDANYDTLLHNFELMKTWQGANRENFKIVQLPMPEPVVTDGLRLPASYANFYIANQTVLVPIFGSKRDKLALDILQTEFNSRKVIGIDCRTLVWGLGAIHCCTQQEPL